MTTEIRIAQPYEEKEWDDIIAKSLHGTIFHQWKWLKITEKHTQTTLYPLIGMKGNTPLGVFPLFFQKKGPIRMVFSPPPHAVLFYLGPVLAGYDNLKQEKREINYISFQKAVEQFITIELKAQYVSISLAPSLQDPRPFIWSGYSFEPHYDYVIDLSIGLDSLLQKLDKKGAPEPDPSEKTRNYCRTRGEKRIRKDSGSDGDSVCPAGKKYYHNKGVFFGSL